MRVDIGPNNLYLPNGFLLGAEPLRTTGNLGQILPLIDFYATNRIPLAAIQIFGIKLDVMVVDHLIIKSRTAKGS